MDDNLKLVAEARKFIGVRWVHHGRSIHGLDCIGLPIVCATNVLGLSFEIPTYSRVSEDDSMLEWCQKNMTKVNRVDMAPGNIVVMGFNRQRHMAMIGDYALGGLSIIHSYLPNKMVVESRFDSVWQSRIIGVFDFRKMTHV